MKTMLGYLVKNYLFFTLDLPCRSIDRKFWRKQVKKENKNSRAQKRQ